MVTGAVFVDHSAAYDTVNDKALIYKVTQVIKNSTITQAIHSLVENRRFFY